MADLGDPPVDYPVETQAAEVRPVRKMPCPGRGDDVVSGDQRVDVITDHAADTLDGLLIVVASTLQSVTRRSMAVVDVIRRYYLVELLWAALAVRLEICPNRILWRHAATPIGDQRVLLGALTLVTAT